jgi:hypothetical protein
MRLTKKRKRKRKSTVKGMMLQTERKTLLEPGAEMVQQSANTGDY